MMPILSNCTISKGSIMIHSLYLQKVRKKKGKRSRIVNAEITTQQLVVFPNWCIALINWAPNHGLMSWIDTFLKITRVLFRTTYNTFKYTLTMLDFSNFALSWLPSRVCNLSTYYHLLPTCGKIKSFWAQFATQIVTFNFFQIICMM